MANNEKINDSVFNPEEQVFKPEEQVRDLENTSESKLERFGKKAWEVLTTREFQKQTLKTVAGAASSYFGVKSFYDVPAYLRQRFKVRGIAGMGKGVEGSVDDILVSYDAETGEKKEKLGDKMEDLESRLALTKDAGKKGSEARKLLAELIRRERGKKSMQEIEGSQSKELLDKVLGEYDKKTEWNQEDKAKLMDSAMNDYTETKINGIQAAKEALNTVFTASGTYGLRGISYTASTIIERRARLAKEARREGEEGPEWGRDVFVGGIKESFADATFQSDGTKLQKALKAVKSYGAMTRLVGAGIKWDSYDESVEKLLDTLDGETEWSQVGRNFARGAENFIFSEAEASESVYNEGEVENLEDIKKNIFSKDEADFDKWLKNASKEELDKVIQETATADNSHYTDEDIKKMGMIVGKYNELNPDDAGSGEQSFKVEKKMDVPEEGVESAKEVESDVLETRKKIFAMNDADFQKWLKSTSAEEVEKIVSSLEEKYTGPVDKDRVLAMIDKSWGDKEGAPDVADLVAEKGTEESNLGAFDEWMKKIPKEEQGLLQAIAAKKEDGEIVGESKKQFIEMYNKYLSEGGQELKETDSVNIVKGELLVSRPKELSEINIPETEVSKEKIGVFNEWIKKAPEEEQALLKSIVEKYNKGGEIEGADKAKFIEIYNNFIAEEGKKFLETDKIIIDKGELLVTRPKAEKDIADMVAESVAAKEAAERVEQLEPESFQIAEDVKAKRGDSIWTMAERYLEGNDKFKELKGSNALREALETYNIDRIKDTIVADPEDYGLPKDVNVDKLTIKQLNSIDWQKAFDDTFLEADVTEALTEEQAKGVLKSNRVVEEAVKTLEEHEAEDVDIPETKVAADEIYIDNELIIKKDSQMAREWDVWKDRSAEKFLQGDFGEAVGPVKETDETDDFDYDKKIDTENHLDAAEIRHREKLQGLLDNARGLIGEPQEGESVEDFLGRYNIYNADANQNLYKSLAHEGMISTNSEANSKIFGIVDKMPGEMKKILMDNFEANKNVALGYVKLFSGHGEGIKEGIKEMFSYSGEVNPSDLEMRSDGSIVYGNAFGRKGYDLIISKNRIGVDGPFNHNLNISGVFSADPEGKLNIDNIKSTKQWIITDSGGESLTGEQKVVEVDAEEEVVEKDKEVKTEVKLEPVEEAPVSEEVAEKEAEKKKTPDLRMVSEPDEEIVEEKKTPDMRMVSEPDEEIASESSDGKIENLTVENVKDLNTVEAVNESIPKESMGTFNNMVKTYGQFDEEKLQREEETILAKKSFGRQDKFKMLAIKRIRLERTS